MKSRKDIESQLFRYLFFGAGVICVVGGLVLWFILGGAKTQQQSESKQTVGQIETEVSKKIKTFNEGGAYYCARVPRFLSKVGLNQPIAIDTAQLKKAGLILREIRGQQRVYQHPSWLQTGHVASTVRDKSGNIYVIPVPSISLGINAMENRNKVYRVDSNTGEMVLFVELPLPESSNLNNPFGTLGLTIDCDTNSLYVSSVAGSTPTQELGIIYQIDLKTGEIIDKLNGVDAIGLAVLNISNTKRLYYGEARSSSLNSLELKNNGMFYQDSSVKPRYEVSLAAVKNGDTTQIKKIDFPRSRSGAFLMRLSETEFGFRLGADTERNYKHYVFKLEKETEKWIFQGLN